MTRKNKRLHFPILQQRTLQSYTTNILNCSFLRTGSPLDKSLLYSIGVAFKDYREKIYMEAGFLDSFQESWKDSVDTSYWLSLEKGGRACRDVLKVCLESMLVFPQWLGETSFPVLEDEDRDAFLYLFQTNGDLFQTIVTKTFSTSSNKTWTVERFYEEWDHVIYEFFLSSMDALEAQIPEKHISKYSQEEKEEAVVQMQHLWHPLLGEILERALEAFRMEVCSVDPVLLLPCLMEALEINIFIVDATTGRPSIECMRKIITPHTFENKHPYLVLLYFPVEGHFESLGKKIKYPKRPLVLTRFFTRHDPFIITYRAYLENQLPDILRKD